MNAPQEGAESILDYSKPTEPVNLTFWQTCKAHPWQAMVALLLVLALIAAIFSASTLKKPFESVLDRQPHVATTPVVTPVVTPVAAPEPAQTSEIPSQPQITPKKIARKAIKTSASGANLPVSDDVLGDFIAELERKKANPLLKNKEPAPSASNLEQDFESRLFNFERKIP
jgi:hypothetical protein